MNYKDRITEILAAANIEVNGSNPWDITVRNEDFYKRAFRGGSLAIGESYMDGWWDCEDLAECVNRLLRARVLSNAFDWGILWLAVKARISNLQRHAKAFEVGEQHYDLGNDLYESTLGPYLQYTCNVWEPNFTTQKEAEERKMKIICDTLNFQPGQRVLDVGCGWGGLAKYAIENYGVMVVGLSVSVEQRKYAEEMCKGLPFTYVVTDWRDYNPDEKFDHITCIEMIEHVGPKNYDKFFSKLSSLLKPDGKLFLQAISFFKDKPGADPWLDKYIFRNAVLSSLYQIEKSSRPYLTLESVNNIGLHYDKTLTEWWKSFNKNYPELKVKNSKYDERFYRMWRYYLLTCAGMFRARFTQDLQVVLSKGVISGR